MFHLRLSLVELGSGFFVLGPAGFKFPMACSKLLGSGPVEFECGSDHLWLGSAWFRCWHAEFCFVQDCSSLVLTCSSVRSGLLRSGSLKMWLGQAGLRVSEVFVWFDPVHCRSVGLAWPWVQCWLGLFRFCLGLAQVDSNLIQLGSALVQIASSWVQFCSSLFHFRFGLIQLGSGFLVVCPAWFKFVYGWFAFVQIVPAELNRGSGRSMSVQFGSAAVQLGSGLVQPGPCPTTPGPS